jgi:hypothetical protein
MRIQTLAAAASVLLISAGASNAATVTETYSISTSSFTGNLPGFTDDLGGKSPSASHALTLTPNTPSSSANFFTISPAGSCGSGCTTDTEGTHHYATDTGTISVTVNYTYGALTGSVTETGTYEAIYGGNPLANCTNSGPGDTDCIVWNGAANSPTGSVTLGLTTSNGLLMNTTFYNANDWNITPKISFDLDPTPIPAALPLFAGGLGFMGLLIRRKRKQQPAI